MDYIDLLMEKAGFPEESKAFMGDLSRRLAADPRYEPLSRKLIDHQYQDFKEIMDVLDWMAPEFGVYKYSLHLAFYLNASELLLDKYRKNNIDEDLFWFVTVDYRCKLIECRTNEGVWGTMSAAWHAPFYHLTRFAHGRLQYDYSSLDADLYEKGGYTIAETPDHQILMHLGHQEYNSSRLLQEAERDRLLGRTDVGPLEGLDPSSPHNAGCRGTPDRRSRYFNGKENVRFGFLPPRLQLQPRALQRRRADLLLLVAALSGA